MRWLGRKLDTFLNAFCAAVVGIVFSQAQAFTQQYLQRLGGHLDEAMLTLRSMENRTRGPNLDSDSRLEMTEQARERYELIENAYETIRGADPLLKPVAMVRNLDVDIFRRVTEDFQPALPLDAASLIYGAAGVALSLILYEVLKLPFRAARWART